MKELKALRQSVGLTQHSLARATSIHRSRIARAELGLAVLTDDELRSIRKAIAAALKRRSEQVNRWLDKNTEAK